MDQIPNTRGIRSSFAQVAWLRLGSGKLEILKCGFWAPFQDRKDATISKSSLIYRYFQRINPEDLACRRVSSYFGKETSLELIALGPFYSDLSLRKK